MWCWSPIVLDVSHRSHKAVVNSQMKQLCRYIFCTPLSEYFSLKASRKCPALTSSWMTLANSWLAWMLSAFYTVLVFHMIGHGKYTQWTGLNVSICHRSWFCCLAKWTYSDISPWSNALVNLSGGKKIKQCFVWCLFIQPPYFHTVQSNIFHFSYFWFSHTISA